MRIAFLLVQKEVPPEICGAPIQTIGHDKKKIAWLIVRAEGMDRVLVAVQICFFDFFKDANPCPTSCHMLRFVYCDPDCIIFLFVPDAGSFVPNRRSAHNRYRQFIPKRSTKSTFGLRIT